MKLAGLIHGCDLVSNRQLLIAGCYGDRQLIPGAEFRRKLADDEPLAGGQLNIRLACGIGRPAHRLAARRGCGNCFAFAFPGSALPGKQLLVKIQLVRLPTLLILAQEHLTALAGFEILALGVGEPNQSGRLLVFKLGQAFDLRWRGVFCIGRIGRGRGEGGLGAGIVLGFERGVDGGFAVRPGRKGRACDLGQSAARGLGDADMQRRLARGIGRRCGGRDGRRIGARRRCRRGAAQ